jgi:hypothetical protein
LGKEKAAGIAPAAFIKSWLPTLDNLRNFFLITPTAEIVSFLQEFPEPRYSFLKSLRNCNARFDNYLLQN